MESRNKPSSGLGVVWVFGAIGAVVLASVAIVARPDQTETETAAVPEPAHEEAAVSLAMAAEVQVQVTDSVIEIPAEITAGETTFIVRNRGEKELSLKVQRGDWEAGLPRALKPGETGRFTAALDAGIYEVFCPNATEIKKARLRVIPATPSPTT